MEPIYRINCGSNETYTDGEGIVWIPDFGFVGGAVALREKTRPLHKTTAPELYRAERYNMDGYNRSVEAGTYTLCLHFAETFDT